jgi:hypothetical protein
MAELLSSVSFRTSTSLVPFVLHVNDRGHATVPERLLCLRFHLQPQSLLVEREEFDCDGNLLRTVYQSPVVTDSGSFYKVFPGSYTIIGGIRSVEISQDSSLSPATVSSFQRRSCSRLKPTLPSVTESPEFNVLSSSDDEDTEPAILNVVKRAIPLLNSNVKLKHPS